MQDVAAKITEPPEEGSWVSEGLYHLCLFPNMAWNQNAEEKKKITERGDKREDMKGNMGGAENQ